ACVLLVRPAPETVPVTADKDEDGSSEAATLGDTLSAGDGRAAIPAERDALHRLRALVGPRGGVAEGLADGTLVGSWIGPSVARDQAARAARAALLARRRLPGAALTLASGMTEPHGARPLGAALDRAVALLDAGEASADAVSLDDVT